MRRTFKLALLCSILLGCGIILLPFQSSFPVAGPPGPGADRVELPVRMVVLYSSGVGYFDHGGTVQGNGSTELRFKAGQINDILKSLVLEDMDGGKIGAIAYPSQDPIDKTLKGFQVDIASNPSLPDLLNQMRGAPVVVTAQAEQIEGTVLGLEKRQRAPAGKNDKTVEEWVLNILSGASMRSIWLDEVRKVEMRDSALEGVLQKALSAQVRDPRDREENRESDTGTGELPGEPLSVIGAGRPLRAQLFAPNVTAAGAGNTLPWIPAFAHSRQL